MKPEGTQEAGSVDIEALEAAHSDGGAELFVVPATVITDEAIKSAVIAALGNLSNLWQVRGFRSNVSRVYPFDSGDGSSQTLADVIVEIGTTGMMQDGIRIVRRSYNENARPELANQSGLVVQLNTRKVGAQDGGRGANLQIFETETAEATRKLKAWKREVTAAYEQWAKQTGATDEAASLFDSAVIKTKPAAAPAK